MNSWEPTVHKLDVLSSWWCGLLLVLMRKREQVCPTRIVCEEEKRENVLSHVDWYVLLLASEEAKREREWLARPFMLPGEVIRAKWHQSFSLDEIYKFETPTVKTIPALNNDLKFFLLHVQCLSYNLCYRFRIYTEWLHTEIVIVKDVLLYLVISNVSNYIFMSLYSIMNLFSNENFPEVRTIF